MVKTIAWAVTSRLAIAASWLPRPIYWRLLSYVLQPALRLAYGVEAKPHPAPAPRPAAPAEPARPAIPPPAPTRGATGPRALIIDGFTPTPDRDAASTDIYWFMRILLEAGYEVTFVPAFSTAHAGRYTDDLRRVGIVCPVAPELASAHDFLVAHGSTFDLIALYRITVAERLLDVARHHAPRAKILFNTVDLHFLRDQRRAEADGQLHAFVEARRRETTELAAIRSADAAVLLSEFEYDYVGRHVPGAHHFFIPLAMPVPGRLAPYEGRSGVLFVGGFAHAPNVDAVHVLCRDIWPMVRAELPHARLFVAGADPPGEIAAYHAPSQGVEILGHVEDLTDLYRSVRLSVAPLLYGAGLKGKVVASLAVGLPCVVTSVGAEGMPPGGAGAIAVADDPRDFARAIVSIHEGAERWERMSDAGVAYAQDNFSVEAVSRRVHALLQSLGLPETG